MISFICKDKISPHIVVNNIASMSLAFYTVAGIKTCLTKCFEEHSVDAALAYAITGCLRIIRFIIDVELYNVY